MVPGCCTDHSNVKAAKKLRIPIGRNEPEWRTVRAALTNGGVVLKSNQGDAMIGMASINWLKVILTYCVPYAMRTYGAVSYQMRQCASKSAVTDSSHVPTNDHRTK